MRSSRTRAQRPPGCSACRGRFLARASALCAASAQRKVLAPSRPFCQRCSQLLHMLHLTDESPCACCVFKGREHIKPLPHARASTCCC